MNTSQFMDKQIMDLSSSSSSKDFIDLMNNSKDDDHQKHRGSSDNGLESKKEEILPSYDFQPIRPSTTNVGLSHSGLNLAGSAIPTAARVWTSSDSKTFPTSPRRNYGSLDSLEPAKFVLEKDRNFPDATLLSEIDQTVKKHTDNLLHALEGVSARLSQLETRTHNVENLVDDLKVYVGNNHGSTDGRMRQLENILREVQNGVQLVKDKQEIVEAQLKLSKIQVSKADQQSETPTISKHVDSAAQPAAPAPQALTPQLPSMPFPQPPSSAAPLPAIPQQPPPQQISGHFPPPQQEPYFPPTGQAQTQPPPNQLPYQVPPPAQPPQPSSAAPPHQLPHQPPPQPPQYSQQPPPPPPPQLSQLQPPSSGYHTEEPPFPLQTYPRQPPPGSATSQHYYSAAPHPPSMYDTPPGRSSSGFPSGYSSDPYSYGGPPMKPPHMSGGGTGYPQLPTARPLPHALPMASGVSSSGSGSPRSGSRVPIDDVVDKVTSMGFPRDQVRATVRKLTENGQAVDLNMVLDKLMNDGGGMQQHQPPPRGWLGGR